jgi:hypothetical protein
MKWLFVNITNNFTGINASVNISFRGNSNAKSPTETTKKGKLTTVVESWVQLIIDKT